MPKSPSFPTDRINVSLIGDDPEKLYQLRNKLEEKSGARWSWAEVIRHAITKLHSQEFNQ